MVKQLFGKAKIYSKQELKYHNALSEFELWLLIANFETEQIVEVFHVLVRFRLKVINSKWTIHFA